MTERQVVEVSDNVYEGAWRDGRYHPKLSVVFEKAGGQWLVGQRL